MRVSAGGLLGCLVLLSFPFPVGAIEQSRLHEGTLSLEPRVVEWRRDIHQHPELGNREFRTAALVASHLEALGLEVRTGIAHTGVAALLTGGRPGPLVALRADMDALPVTEQTGLPFASRVTTEFAGQQTGVMHACGHDAHTAILMGVAELLAGLRDELPGSVLFIFQPAEEGPPDGEAPLLMGAEDFSLFANEVPGFYFFLGATPEGVDASTAPMNHSPMFDVDESTLRVGVEALATLAVDFLQR
jgi:metal-dependent amidase/aminoacylase/carboxypeptidase family protein